ncbi:STAS/SEC14 domain-containing protein [uncultured Dokdonia sp.]|uniref:STAS/SEC14 domain-containing protein n=1 Tax=uncultured Dokdonia sp. TaxID=575653 RepID=UPI0026066F0A|nr:STAS/SEC14 domain-containing protein [uncultured Dokdonia sp.]
MLADFSFADNTVGYLIEGTMDKDAIVALRSQVLEKFKSHDKINLYLEDSNIEHFSLSAATIGALFPLEHSKRFHKIALVTDRKWIHALAAIDNALIGATLKYFPIKDRLSAISWIADVHV